MYKLRSENVGILVYFRKEGRALEEVTKYACFPCQASPRTKKEKANMKETKYDEDVEMDDDDGDKYYDRDFNTKPDDEKVNEDEDDEEAGKVTY
jgi:hypothetical protein